MKKHKLKQIKLFIALIRRLRGCFVVFACYIVPFIAIFPFAFMCAAAQASDSRPSCTYSSSQKRSASLYFQTRDFPLSKQCKPCDNFYRYVCEETIKRFRLPVDRSHYVFSFSDASERILQAKKQYLKQLSQGKVALSNDRLTRKLQIALRDYFLASYDSRARRKQEIEEIRRVVQELSRLDNKEAIKKWLADNITKVDNVSWIEIDTIDNRHNPQKQDLAIYLNILSLPEPSYYQDEAVMRDFVLLLEKFFADIGCTEPKIKARFVADFERDLAAHTLSSAEEREYVLKPNRVLRGAWQKRYANFRLDRLWVKIPPLVVVREFSGENAWSWLNKRLDQLSVDQLHALLLYQNVFGMIEESYPGIYQAKLRFRRKHLGAAPKLPSKLERATFRVIAGLGRELDYVLMPQLFPNFPKRRVAKMVERVRQSLIVQLAENGWLSASGQKAAINKIKHLRFSLVYPDKLSDWDMAPILDYDPQKPLTNQRRLAQARLDQKLKELTKPVPSSRWYISPLTVNAYYNPSRNVIVIPLGILQPPFYDQRLPDVINLGGIGAVIGHEMGHAIDDVGNHYDADGRYKAWMSDRDKHCFKLRSAKLITQFNAIGHDGRLTLGENIGDLVGLTTAYRAADWDKMAKKTKKTNKSINKQKEIDELKRQFFIQFARLWCACERPGNIKRRLLTDPHSLEWARVNQNVKQQTGFKKAFKCRAGDAMVLPKKELIRVW